MRQSRLVMLFLGLMASALCHLASAQEIRDIITKVQLFHDGNALVSQIWDLTATEGTEWYIPIDNPGKSRITHFTVIENGVEFESDGDQWNSKRSMAEKTQRCGIVHKKGDDIELCWGLGSYGDHKFGILYIIEGLVQDYGDCDGFHWHFLNDEWYVCPKHASVTFVNKSGSDAWYWNSEEDSNVRFWGFGMVGDSGIEDGVITFESTEPLRYKSFFSAMMQFNKGMFEPKVTADGTFEELKKEALEGSDYDSGDDGFDQEKAGRILLIIILLIPALFILFIIYRLLCMLYWKVSGRHYDKKIFGKSKISDWWRDVPLEGNPTALFSLLCTSDKLITNFSKRFPNLVSAYFLKWIQDGLLAVERDADKFERVNLRFVKGKEDLQFNDYMEGVVYRAALDAAGENLLLEKNEFKSWSYRHDSTVVTWPNRAISSGEAVWKPLSQEERCHAVEFKNYLSDFTLMDQREAPEVGLWKQYMVMAAAMGIADKVAKNFEKLFPQTMEEYTRNSNMTDVATTYLVLSSLNDSSRAMMASAIDRDAQRQAAAAQARRSSGGGGSISFGGGGGGFGGGHGGGAR
ncbi:MAG: DUF2207 domain-containing protein [Bacteroidales bacterium]|nr:DUF2207 domain-containing protein [Bacteroidales bacterium]